MIEDDAIKKPIFNLPISFLENKRELEAHVITDLELKKTETTKSLYEYVFTPETVFAEKTIPLWNKYYTTDKKFIKDSQKLIKKISNNKKISKKDGENSESNQAQEYQAQEHKQSNQAQQHSNVEIVWNEIKSETGFVEKYHYIDWSFFEKFNNNAQFLQILSIYNMSSPALSLMMPIMFIILPFFILKLQGIPLTMGKYIEILKQIFKNHQIGQIFNIANASVDKIIYVVVSFAFYILQIYQNIISCINFYKNMKKIHEQLFITRDYLKTTLEDMSQFKEHCKNLSTYNPFIAEMDKYSIVLQHMYDEFSIITPNKVSFKKFTQIGHIMKCFYQLYKNKSYHESLEYAFGFSGYISNLNGLCKNIKLKNISACKLSKKEIKFTGAFFPTLVNNNPVKNDYTLDKHLLITGPNAAGKTTLLKTTIFNIILSQQVGCGFYKSAKINPYDIIHCYINIPDTSARDSLFQAEARRCKNILTQIVENNNKIRHFCVFDELYSGTNPYEAIGSAYAFLTYLNKHKNVKFILTTHYLDLCKRLEVSKETVENVENYNMKIITDVNNDFKYTYKLQHGISHIKGGIKVLKDLDYPKEIIERTTTIIKELII
jgi:hypothetical protein